MAEEIERLEDHDIAAVFPLLPKAELEELAKDIETNGLLNPILLYEGKILDGRNRYRAILSLPALKEYLDPEWYQRYLGNDPVGHVISLNCHRRHLTGAQRAAIASELANKKLGDNQHGGSAILPTLSVDQAKAAKLFNVSERSVRTAKAIKEADPELHSKVKSGEVSLNAAYKQIRPASVPEPPRSWTAPEVNTEEDGEVSEETSKDLAAKEPINPTKRQFNFQLKKFIRKMCELFKVPKKEIEENIKEYFLAKDKHQ